MKDIVQVAPHLWEIDGRFRVEAGLPFVETIADADVLHDSVTHPDYKVGNFDARGNIIEHGKPFAYIDFYAPDKHTAGQRPHPHNFKVYRLDSAGPDDPVDTHKEYKLDERGSLIEDTAHPMHHKRWTKQGEFETPEEAFACVEELMS
jgi:hypothetical protein